MPDTFARRGHCAMRGFRVTQEIALVAGRRAQSPEAFALDRSLVYENIVPASVGRDEAVPCRADSGVREIADGKR